MGPKRHPHGGDRARRVPDSRRVRSTPAEGRDEGWSSGNPLGPHRRARRIGQSREFSDLRSGGYINGEMVVQDGGAHLRSSGAEDLLQWTDAQWEKQRAARAKELRSPLRANAVDAEALSMADRLPRRCFPAIHRPGDAGYRAIFQSQ